MKCISGYHYYTTKNPTKGVFCIFHDVREHLVVLLYHKNLPKEVSCDTSRMASPADIGSAEVEVIPQYYYIIYHAPLRVVGFEPTDTVVRLSTLITVFLCAGCTQRSATPSHSEGNVRSEQLYCITKKPPGGGFLLLSDSISNIRLRPGGVPIDEHYAWQVRTLIIARKNRLAVSDGSSDYESSYLGVLKWCITIITHNKKPPHSFGPVLWCEYLLSHLLLL